MPADAQRRYQVFVSSTFLDLQDERRKILEAILELEAFPAGMELFPAANDEQWEFIRRQIASSDYYVIVLGGRYGSLAADGVSFTEKEYDYAVKLQIPIIGFLRRDLAGLRPPQIEEDAQAQKQLEEFRRKISAGRLIKYFENGDDLKARVSQALSYAFQNDPRQGWLRASSPPPKTVKLPIRPAVGDILSELSRGGEGVIERLVYVVSAIDSEEGIKRFNLIAAECDRVRFVAVHLRDVEHRVTDPLDTIHDLIGRANLVIFDLSRPDPNVTYQLGVQRGFGEIAEDGVLLLTDDLSTPAVKYAPFAIQPFSSDSDLRLLVRKSLALLRPQRKGKSV